MKTSKAARSKRTTAVAVAEAAAPQTRMWPYAVGILGALFVTLQVYWPAMYGPFLLDDTYLPYMLPGFENAPFIAWVKGVRPVLMFSYWSNYQHAFQAGSQLGNQETFAYHMVNFVLHFLNGALILLAVRKLLEWTGTEKWLSWVLSIFAAGLFLLHPAQTESVSYIASRSETLSVFFVLAAFVVFVYRQGDSVSVGRALAVLALFGFACLSKEHTAVLPALFLLTDYYWNPGFSLAGIRRNWKLYIPIVLGAAAGVLFVLRVLKNATTAGFNIQGLHWYDYFFTQCRVIWRYLFLFILPIGQNVDPDIPISHGVVDHGAIIGLIGLLAMSVAAWIYRRRFPLASFGWFTFLILLAPTSSFVPILDPMAERRMYLPFVGLLLITVEFLRRWKTSRMVMVAALSLVLIVESGATYQRNQLWGTGIDLWKDSVAKSPNKVRPRFQLAKAYFDIQHFGEAVDEFQKTAQLAPPTYDLLIDWGLSYDGLGKFDEAVDRFRKAAAMEPTAHVYSQIGMEYGKAGKYPEALDALAQAVRIDPNFAMTYQYRGMVYSQQGDKVQAAEDFRHVLRIDPNNQPAREALKSLGQ